MKRVYIYNKSLRQLEEVEYLPPSPRVHILNDKANNGNYIRCEAIRPEEGVSPYFESKSKYVREVKARGYEIVGNDYVGIDPVKHAKRYEKKIDKYEIAEVVKSELTNLKRAPKNG
jgi:hypothetical protein